jgi:hypothetical protein
MSCGGSTAPVNQDAAVPDKGFSFPDVTVPDVGTKKDGKPADQYVWPDQSTPKDVWSPPTDSYTGAPFGCQTDLDCFGQKCCATPWGVKLCAATCQ